MNLFTKTTALIIAGLFMLPVMVHAQTEPGTKDTVLPGKEQRTPKDPEAATAAKAEVKASAEVDEVKEEKKDSMIQAIQNHYGLSDGQIALFQQKKMSTAQMVRASETSVKSGQSVEAVLALRYDQRMSWTKVTRTLKVSEGDIRSANASISRERKDLVKQIARGQQMLNKNPGTSVNGTVNTTTEVNADIDNTKTTRIKQVTRENVRGTVKDTPLPVKAKAADKATPPAGEAEKK